MVYRVSSTVHRCFFLYKGFDAPTGVLKKKENIVNNFRKFSQFVYSGAFAQFFVDLLSLGPRCHRKGRNSALARVRICTMLAAPLVPMGRTARCDSLGWEGDRCPQGASVDLQEERGRKVASSANEAVAA